MGALVAQPGIRLGACRSERGVTRVGLASRSYSSHPRGWKKHEGGPYGSCFTNRQGKCCTEDVEGPDYNRLQHRVRFGRFNDSVRLSYQLAMMKTRAKGHLGRISSLLCGQVL